MKPQRWYSINPDNKTEFLVFDQPLLETSTMVSIIKQTDLQYYRNNFTLRKSES